MNLELADKIARAVLYEGYLLYPYRASATKNRQRWNFGSLYPAEFGAVSGGTDASAMQTQCLARCGEQASVDVKVRFLHFLSRQVFAADAPEQDRNFVAATRADQDWITVSDLAVAPFHPVEFLEAGGRLFQTWQEAVEREAGAVNLSIASLCNQPHRLSFAFDSLKRWEPVAHHDERVTGAIAHQQESINGNLEVSAEPRGNGIFRITARIENLTPFGGDPRNREYALMKTFVSTHTLIGANGCELISLLEPPEQLRDEASRCENAGTYPVLIGNDGDRDLILSSPIILYDYPQIAPESTGDLFDSTEIDEILSLRILTLTDEEKRAMRNVDDRARQILERTESMPLEQLMKLHGAVRGLRPVTND